jgi:hypothetical protein
VRIGDVRFLEGRQYDGGLQMVFEASWLFWLLVIFLFAESWARVWAAYHRGADEPGAPGKASAPDVST